MAVINIENYFHIIQCLDIIKKNSQLPTFKVEKRTNIYGTFKSLFYYILYSSQVLFGCGFKKKLDSFSQSYLEGPQHVTVEDHWASKLFYCIILNK